MIYYTYLLRCADGSLYAGIASDLKRRMDEHRSGDGRAARYTRSHPPRALVAAWRSADRAAASRLEYRLKRLPKERKEALAAGETWENVFGALLSAADYIPVPFEELALCFPPEPEEKPAQ